MIRKTLSDGRVLQFPDGTDPAVIARKTAEMGGEQSGQGSPGQASGDPRRELQIESALAMVQAAASSAHQTAQQLARMQETVSSAVEKLGPALEVFARMEKAMTAANAAMTRLEKAMGGVNEAAGLGDVLKAAIDNAAADIIAAVMAPVVLDKDKAGKALGSHKEMN